MSEELNESESKIKIEIDLKRRIFGGRRRRRLQGHPRRFVNEWLMMFSITVALLIPEFRGAFGSFEGSAFDSYRRWIPQSHEKKSPDVVVLDIDDDNCLSGHLLSRKSYVKAGLLLARPRRTLHADIAPRRSYGLHCGAASLPRHRPS